MNNEVWWMYINLLRNGGVAPLKWNESNWRGTSRILRWGINEWKSIHEMNKIMMRTINEKCNSI